MATRGWDAESVSEQFLTFAAAEGERIPVYAQLCRSIAREPTVHELLLAAPLGQRLPVMLLAALHDVVLRHPGTPVAPWFSVPGAASPEAGQDPGPALAGTVDRHRGELLELLRTRQVQTNEVNRCTAWWAGLRHLCAPDTRLPLALVELGASAGLNLRLDDYAYRFDWATGSADAGRRGSDVRLGTNVRTGPWPEVAGPLPPVVARVGIEQRPVDVTDAADTRWLRACVWPEQRLRQQRLDAALRAAAVDPPPVVHGDLVDDLPDVVRSAARRVGGPAHIVVVSSWVLAYIPRERRSELRSALVDLSDAITAVGGRVSLLTLEADHVLPWQPPPPLPPGSGADEQHASILAATTFHPDLPLGGTTEVLARCQAHLAWIDRL